MLLAKIETHNEVNGVAFSVAAFALIAHARVASAVVRSASSPTR